MPAIFPPSGIQDGERFAVLKGEEREYMWFCVEFCDAILRRRPNHREALAVAANHYTELGYYADGLLLDRRLADLRPRDPEILYNLSCSLALTGRPEEALDCLEQAVACGYADFRHMSADRDLASLRGTARFNALLAKAAGNKL